MNAEFRLILDPPRSAVLNMAIDEILMERQLCPDPVPTLRFYSWDRPAYSIGYFQNINKTVSHLGIAKSGIPVVRRITGGGLVFHGNDLAFSLTVKGDNPFFLGAVKNSYLNVHEAVRGGLRPLYPKIDYADCRHIPSGRGKENRVCFEAPSCYDLLLDGKKIAGASQRRRGGAILHQSAIFLPAARQTLIRHIIKGFKENWKVGFIEKPLSQAEFLDARRKEKARAAAGDWVYAAEDLERSFFS
ncbi:MAG: hypothetical protein COT00_02390 [Candidatus Omnitrophica bacterium CG07_land_8_20_14_0_80_50_8]|nr:MAG: hypothetical protein COT00_02390 [Candidatus Omnitrophica bacterium CG07_land_8_20_14_0_80_50_8]